MGMIEWAEKERVDLLVFPETSLTGYLTGADAAMSGALPLDSGKLKTLAQECRTTYAVVGLIELGQGGLIYNSIVWLHRGQILAVHRKINLPTYGRLEEGRYFAKGEKTTCIELKEGWICGGLICADLWDPGQLYLTALSNPALLAVPVASTLEALGSDFSNPEGWDLVCRYTALIYGLPVIRCNWVGASLDMTFWGGSAIYGPDGRELCNAGNGEGVITAMLSLEDVMRARQILPTVRTLNSAHLSRELASLEMRTKV